MDMVEGASFLTEQDFTLELKDEKIGGTGVEADKIKGESMRPEVVEVIDEMVDTEDQQAIKEALAAAVAVPGVETLSKEGLDITKEFNPYQIFESAKDIFTFISKLSGAGEKISADEVPFIMGGIALGYMAGAIIQEKIFGKGNQSTVFNVVCSVAGSYLILALRPQIEWVLEKAFS